jgi:DNA-binding transcriptional regulator GbsR (MarR family)
VFLFACKINITDYISVMTEITGKNEKINPIPLPIESFVLHWGDLGGSWGVNRSISQIHAFLYLAERPLSADEIATQLDMARSNVSNSLRELLSWKLVRRVPIKGDRREHFEAEIDVWKVAMLIAAGRKSREIDPAIEVLKQCTIAADQDENVSKVARQRLHAMLEFTTSVDRWYGQMLSMSHTKREMILRLGSKIASFLPANKRRNS